MRKVVEQSGKFPLLRLIIALVRFEYDFAKKIPCHDVKSNAEINVEENRMDI